jgi:hypothetical protein
MHIVWLKLLTNLMLFAVAVLVVASCLGEDGSEMFLSFPGFHQPKLLKKARGRDQTLTDSQISSSF